MKHEDLFFVIVLSFITLIVGCLIVNGEVPDKPFNKPSVEFIDSEMSYNTIKDVRFLTNNYNKHEETDSVTILEGYAVTVDGDTIPVDSIL